MENQINMGDQNVQQVGQNLVNQPVQNPEKPKLNRWMISTVVLSFLLIGLGGLYVFNSKSLKQDVNIGVNPTPAEKSKSELPPSKYELQKTIVYAVQKDSSNNQLDLLAIKPRGEKVNLSEYKSSYEIGSTSNVPKLARTGLLLYLGERSKLYTIDTNRNKKLLAESVEGNEIRDFIISEDGTTVIYQEFNKPEPGQSCTNFFLRSANTLTEEKQTLYTSNNNYFRPIKISNDKTRVFVLGGSLAGGEASCYGAANILQTIDLTTKAISTVKTFRISTNHPTTIELGNGILISPDEKYGVIAYSTNPASPLISTPSKQYPVKLTIIDLSNGLETSLTESIDRYLFPVDWYSNSKSVLYREQAPDTVDNYQNIKDVYKSIDIQSKKIIQLFVLDRRGSGMEYDRLVDDSVMVYTERSDQDWINGTSLKSVNLDGSNMVTLDKQVRFLYLVGVY